MGVGTGHAVQGFLGISAFRGAYNRASGNTENTTKFFKTQYQAPTSDFGDRSSTTRTKTQAKYAGHGAATGIGLSVFAGFIPSVVGGLLGGICGGAVRLFKGERAKTAEDLKQVADKGPSETDVVNLKKAHTKSMNRVAEMISKKTNSVEQGLQIARRPPAKTRFDKFAGNDNLPSKDSVRTYQAFSEHSFIKEFSTENQDFLLAMKLLDVAPTKDNFDFMCRNFVDDSAEQGININFKSRNELRSILARDTNGQIKMNDAIFNQLQAAVANGPDSNEFQQLPGWIQNNLTDGMNRRGANELNMVDIFHSANDQITSLVNTDSIVRLSSNLFAGSK